MPSLRMTPVEGPAAWKSTDASIKDGSYKTLVTEEHIAEIDAALEATASKEELSIIKEDLPTMPHIARLFEGIQGDLEGGRGFAMLGGLPVERWGLEKTSRALWIIGLHLGAAEPQDKAGSLIHHVKDTGAKFENGNNVRYFQTNIAIPFHTDGSDALAFICFSKGRSGGLSRLASAVTGFNEVLRRRPDLAQVLQENFHFDARGQHPTGALCQVHPLYSFHNGHLNLIHKIPYIMSAQSLDGVPKLTAAQQEALDFLDTVLNEKEHVIEFESEPGDIQFASNHTVVHGRTAFEDDGGSASKRHFLRLWVTLPNGHETPPHYVETREHMHASVRRLPVDVSVFDGSVGRLLVNSGIPICPNIWSGKSITEEQYHPTVIDAHRKYIEAGCDMITTNNYTVQPCYYRKAFDDWEARIPKDAATAARLACEARKLYAKPGQIVRVLGCLPPLCESHRPDLATEFIAKEGKPFIIKTYRGIAEGLLKGGPIDVFLAETMNTWEEANCAIEAVKDLGKPIIVSMEGGLRDNNLKCRPKVAAEIAENVLALKKAGVPIEALCFNCVDPEVIAAAVKVLDDGGFRSRLHAAGILLGAYANVHARKAVLDGEGFDASKVDNATIKVRADLENEGYVGHLHNLIRSGVHYVGGCCGSTPEQMRMLSDSLKGVEGDAASAPKRRRLSFCQSFGAK